MDRFQDGNARLTSFMPPRVVLMNTLQPALTILSFFSLSSINTSRTAEDTSASRLVSTWPRPLHLNIS
jgi:hypothetical protein